MCAPWQPVHLAADASCVCMRVICWLSSRRTCPCLGARQAEERMLAANENKEYLPIGGWVGCWDKGSRGAAVPCRAVPCRAVPCRAVPCRAVPCRAVGAAAAAAIAAAPLLPLCRMSSLLLRSLPPPPPPPLFPPQPSLLAPPPSLPLQRDWLPSARPLWSCCWALTAPPSRRDASRACRPVATAGRAGQG